MLTRTLVLAIELSNTSWVLVAQVPGLARVKAKQTIEPTAEALLAAIGGYRRRARGAVERVVGGHGGQLDEGIVAQRRPGFQGHVAGPLHGPFIVLFQQDGPDEADHGRVIGEDADDLGA